MYDILEICCAGAFGVDGSYVRIDYDNFPNSESRTWHRNAIMNAVHDSKSNIRGFLRSLITENKVGFVALISYFYVNIRSGSREITFSSKNAPLFTLCLFTALLQPTKFISENYFHACKYF